MAFFKNISASADGKDTRLPCRLPPRGSPKSPNGLIASGATRSWVSSSCPLSTRFGQHLVVGDSRFVSAKTCRAPGFDKSYSRDRLNPLSRLGYIKHG